MLADRGDMNMNEKWLISFFKDLHAHPELAWQETRTTAKVREILEANKITCLETGTKTGLIAVIRGPREGRVIGLR